MTSFWSQLTWQSCRTKASRSGTCAASWAQQELPSFFAGPGAFLFTTAEVPLNELWRPIPACTLSCEYQELIREDLEELRAVHVADLEEPRAAPLVDMEEPRAMPLVDLEELRAVPLVDLEGPRPAPLVDLAEPRAVDQESADLWSGLFAPDAGPVDLVEPEPRPGQPSCKRHKTG